MSSEKAEALSASGLILADHAARLGDDLAKAAVDETRLALGVAQATSLSLDPARAAQAQFDYAVGWWGRAGARWLSMNAALTQAQADAIAPIHKAATANARRLRKR